MDTSDYRRPAPTSVRLPEPLRARVAARAAAERRSFSNQLRVLLEDALASTPTREERLVRALIETLDAREVEAP
jgi:hypothetical protein